MPLDSTAMKTVTSDGLESGCSGLILAVSGGPDSMAMLAWYAARNTEFPITVAHVHHGLRPESDEEEKLVVQYCNTLQIPCKTFHGDVNRAMRKGETVESAARRIRYEFFRTLAAETGASHLATAHTRDDQCETVLLHLLHGAGPKGLCGILPKRREGDIILIRPLIDCPKEQTVNYCKKYGVPYAIDKSNDDLSYTRNRVRHVLLPEMEKINPNIRETLCRTASALQKQQQAFEARADEFLSAHSEALPADKLKAFPEGEQAEILRRTFANLGKHLSSEQTRQALALLEKETGTVEFDRKYILHLGQNKLSVYEKTLPPSPVPVTEEETLLDDGRTLRLKKVVADKNNRNTLIPVRFPLLLRSRREGDTVRTSGGTKTLKKRMIELKIPQHKRDQLRVLADETHVFWCEGIGTNPETAPKEGQEGYFVSLSEE